MRGPARSCAAGSSTRRRSRARRASSTWAPCLRVGRGVKKEHGAERPSLLADAFEALVAALYFERGYDVAKSFVHDALASDVDEASLAPSDVDPKTLLRQWAELNGFGAPSYEVSSEGPPHEVTYLRHRARGRARRARRGAIEEECRGRRRSSCVARARQCLSCPK